MKKNTIGLISLLVAFMFLTSTCGAWAAVSDPNDYLIQPRTIVTVISAFNASSDVEATASVKGTSNLRDPDWVSVKIVLQSATKGSNDYSDESSVNPASKKASKSKSVVLTHDFPITKAKDYRIKITFQDSINGTVTTTTTYSNLKR